MKKHNHDQKIGCVVWITGLSGSGKTTLATELVSQIREDRNNVICLDGDELREIFLIKGKGANAQSYDRASRLTLAMQYAYLCKLLSMQGLTVVIATISMFSEIYAWNRANIPRYFEVFLKVPVEELRRRDSKGIYYRFDTGDLKHIAGLDLHVDEPNEADYEFIYSSSLSARNIAEKLLLQLKVRNLY